MEEAKRKGDWQKVAELQYGKLPQLEAQLKKADSKLASEQGAKPRLLRTQVGAEEIAEVVSRATGIPGQNPVSAPEQARTVTAGGPAIGWLAALVILAPAAAAQQPRSPAPPSHAPDDRTPMMAMDSLNDRLDSLVGRMNQTSGNQKVQAMAAVINELVSQRKAMQERMHHMMEHDEVREQADQGAAEARPESTLSDSTDHTAHHPQKRD
jgi:hypothetical protein